MFDLIITGGKIADGSGKPVFKGDIGIKDGKISEIGDLTNADSKQKIDAAGKLVTPGFIDVHSHSDLSVLINPNAESKIRQGVTTEVVGQCGDSPFPYRGAYLEREKEFNANYGLDLNWSDFQGYVSKFDEAKPVVNVVLFAGQGSIRGSELGYTGKTPTTEQMNNMKKDVVDAMENGAFGISTGLIYPPGYWADTNELSELVKASAPYGAIYTSHIRGEGDTLLPAITEAIEIGQRAGVSVQISHLKACARRNWGKVKDAIELIMKKRAEGVDVWWDKYPYIASATSLSSNLPQWVIEGGTNKSIERLKDKETLKKILTDMDKGHEKEPGFAHILITSAECVKYKEFEGKRIPEIAKALNKTEEEIFVDLLIESRLSTQMAGFTMSQEDTDMAIEHELGFVCSDSGAYAPYGALGKSKPHPRTYGTFPRFFRYYVKEKKSFTLEDAVKKVTSMPAKRFGLNGRGLIEKGYCADLVIIDWDKFEDKATFDNPHQYAAGIENVIVNGAVSIVNNEITSKRAGRIIRRGEK